MAFSRRRFLIGAGGAVFFLPFFEAFAPRKARAGGAVIPPFAVFYRRANGVQQSLFNQKQNAESEGWWPSLVTAGQINDGPYGPKYTGRYAPMTAGLLSDAFNADTRKDSFNAALPASALQALKSQVLNPGGTTTDYTSKTTVIRNLQHAVEGSLGGHPEGFSQGLTGSGVQYMTKAGAENGAYCDGSTPHLNSNAHFCGYDDNSGTETPRVAGTDITADVRPADNAESLDNRIARELNPAGASQTSLFFAFSAQSQAGVSWGKNAGGAPAKLVGYEDLSALYTNKFAPITNNPTGQAAVLLGSERKSVNDLVKGELTTLENDPRLSKDDVNRLKAHQQAIRDVEIQLTCAGIDVTQSDADTYQDKYNTDADKGLDMMAWASLVAKLSAIAVNCGITRSVLMNIGQPQDINYYSLVSDANGRAPAGSGLNANVNDFHSITHRLIPSGNTTQAAQLHHYLDIFHMNVFRCVLDELSALPGAGGAGTLLDAGVCLHYADLGSGQHETYQLPYLYVGGAGGALATNQYVDAWPGGPGASPTYVTHFLNVLGSAVGCQNTAKTDKLNDFNADTSALSGYGALASLLL